ncbi:6-phospho-beta-glucosidase [Escherichia coli]|nr:6-phospho-beta-glucosidase [Escherichia coli]
MLAIEMGEYYKGGARAQVVQKVEKQLFELYKNPELKVKPKELEQRGGAYYSDAACEVINAIYTTSKLNITLISRIMGILIIFRQTGR